MARPQEFDRAEVINAAIDVFHKQGYGATSVPDLVKATGLQPGSLYAAFGNKKGILIEALDIYSQETNKAITHCFNEADSPLEGIRNFFCQISNKCSNSNGNHGCLMVNSLLEMDPGDKELASHLEKLMNKFEAKFTHQLQACQDSGEISDDQNPEALGKYLVCNLWGLQILAKTKPEAAAIKMVVDQIMLHLKRCT